MERTNGSDPMAACKQVICSLLMLLLGLLFCFPLATLAYYTYQTIIGNVIFCTLWIDVPGRLAIFLTCYYIASMCGFLPLPQRYRLSTFMEPFKVWRLESWRRLFRNLFFPTPSLNLIIRLHKNAMPASESPETPLLRENNHEHFYDCSPIRRRSKPVQIIYPESYVAPVFVSHRESPASNASPEIDKSSNGGSLASFDSSVGGVIVPMMKRKSLKSRYLPESSSDGVPSESPDDRNISSSKYRKRYTVTKWIGETVKPIPDKHTGAMADYERETALKLRNTEAQLNFPGIHNRNQKPGEATADDEREIPPTFRNTETKPNFPRFPWCYLRNPIGLPAGVNKLHKRNLELEKRETDRYFNRQKRQADLKRLARSLLVSLRNESVTETQLPRSSQNINLITRDLLQTQSSSTVAAKSTSEQTRTRSESVINKDETGRTENQSELSQRHEMLVMNAGHRTGGRHPLFSQASNLIQKQEVGITRDQATNRRHLLPSQRFQRKARISSEIQMKAEKTDFALETHRISDPKETGSTTVLEVGLTNLPQFKQDTGRSGLLGPVMEETANESFKRLQVGDLKKRQFRFGQSTQPTPGLSAALKSEQNIHMKTEVQTTDASVEGTTDSSIATKPSEDISPTNKCGDERDSDLEQSEKWFQNA